MCGEPARPSRWPGPSARTLLSALAAGAAGLGDPADDDAEHERDRRMTPTRRLEVGEHEVELDLVAVGGDDDDHDDHDDDREPAALEERDERALLRGGRLFRTSCRLPPCRDGLSLVVPPRRPPAGVAQGLQRVAIISTALDLGPPRLEVPRGLVRGAELVALELRLHAGVSASGASATTCDHRPSCAARPRARAQALGVTASERPPSASPQTALSTATEVNQSPVGGVGEPDDVGSTWTSADAPRVGGQARDEGAGAVADDGRSRRSGPRSSGPRERRSASPPGTAGTRGAVGVDRHRETGHGDGERHGAGGDAVCRSCGSRRGPSGPRWASGWPTGTRAAGRRELGGVRCCSPPARGRPCAATRAARDLTLGKVRGLVRAARRTPTVSTTVGSARGSLRATTAGRRPASRQGRDDALSTTTASPRRPTSTPGGRPARSASLRRPQRPAARRAPGAAPTRSTSGSASCRSRAYCGQVDGIGSHGVPVVKPTPGPDGPRQRHAGAVAVGQPAGGPQRLRVLPRLRRHVGVGQAQLVARVQVERAGQGEQEQVQRERALRSEPGGRRGRCRGCRPPTRAARRPRGAPRAGRRPSGAAPRRTRACAGRRTRTPGPARRRRANAAVRSGGPQASATARRRPSTSCATTGRSRAPPAGPSAGATDARGGPRRSAGSLASPPATSTRNPSTPRAEPEPQGLREVRLHDRVRPVQVRLLGREQVQVPVAVGQAATTPGRRTSTASRWARDRGRGTARARDRRRGRRRTTGAGRTRGWAPGP